MGVDWLMTIDFVSRWLGLVVVIGFFVLVCFELIRYFKTAFERSDIVLSNRRFVSAGKVFGIVLLAFVLSRLFLVGVCAFAHMYDTNGFSDFLKTFMQKLDPWDADHYLDLMRDGYVADGEARLFIVFFPFYPMVCRIFSFLTGFDVYYIAILVSNVALIIAGYMMFRVIELEYNEGVAWKAIWFLMFSPFTYFYSIAYTESVFLLVTLLSVYFAKKRQWVLSVLFGMCASNCRLLGLAVAIPIFWEMLRYEQLQADENDMVTTFGDGFKRIVCCILRVLPVSFGFMLYLLLNWNVYRNPFQFLIYQSEHWHQNFGGLMNTVDYCLKNTFSYHDIWYRFGVWGPQVVTLVGVPLLILFSRRKAHADLAGYTLVYHYVAFMPTWLLSGVRYASACYAFYPMLSLIADKKWKFALMFILELVFFVGIVYVGFWHVKVY